MKKFKSKHLFLFCTFVVLICSMLMFTACKDDTPIDNGLKFSFNLNTQTFQAYSDNKDITDVDIPSSYKDTPVTAIRMTGFLDCSLLENVKIPDSVTTIELCGFYNCSSLKNINLPDGLTTIGEGAFNGCSSLRNIELPESLTTIKSLAFADCRSLLNIVIPAGVTTIGTDAFYGCTWITIFCEAESAPDGWSDGWNSSCRVVWNFHWGS